MISILLPDIWFKFTLVMNLRWLFQRWDITLRIILRQCLLSCILKQLCDPNILGNSNLLYQSLSFHWGHTLQNWILEQGSFNLFILSQVVQEFFSGNLWFWSFIAQQKLHPVFEWVFDCCSSGCWGNLGWDLVGVLFLRFAVLLLEAFLEFVEEELNSVFILELK